MAAMTVEEQIKRAGADKVNAVLAKVKHGGGEGSISKSEAMRQLHKLGFSEYAISKLLSAKLGQNIRPQFVNNVLRQR